MKILFRKRSPVKIDDAGFPCIPNETVAVFVDNTEAERALVIALALNQYMQRIQDYEQASITIQKVIKPYSPWSSKIYGLRQVPNFIPGLRARCR